MDKRDKKRIKALRDKVDRLRQSLAGAKAQADDPGEVARYEKEIAGLLAEIEKLRGGSR